MSVGASQANCNAAIDAAVALGTWIKMHVGDPGANGIANPATETTRHQATMAAASGGAAASTVDLDWIAVAASETYTHFSMWTASTSGTFQWSGTVTGGAVTSGLNFTIPASNLTLTSTGAA